VLLLLFSGPLVPHIPLILAYFGTRISHHHLGL